VISGRSWIACQTVASAVPPLLGRALASVAARALDALEGEGSELPLFVQPVQEELAFA